VFGHPGADSLRVVRLSHHLVEKALGFCGGGPDVAVQIGVQLTLRRGVGGGADLRRDRPAIVDRERQQLVGRQDAIHEPDPCRLLREHDARRQQQVGGMADPHESRQHPRQAVFGGEPQSSRRGRELRARGGETDVAEAGKDETDAGGRAVDRGNDRLRDAVVERVHVLVLGTDAMAGCRKRRNVNARVVFTRDRDLLERVGVASGTEPAACSGHDDHTHCTVGFGARHRIAVLVVHPPCPRVQALGTIQGDGGDAVRNVVQDDAHTAAIAVAARSDRQINKSGDHGSDWL
jgi:hypothetical protein